MLKKLVSILLIYTLLLIFLNACKVNTDVPLDLSVQNSGGDIFAYDFVRASAEISQAAGVEIPPAFLSQMGEEETRALMKDISNGTYSEKSWLNAAGFSYHVMLDILNGTLNAENIHDFGNNGKKTFSISFVGDINFDPDFNNMVHASEMGGILNCFDERVVSYLNQTDVCVINNEYSIGEEGVGKPLSGKTWTFQVTPDKIDILKSLGADIVSLANNHVFDYGEEGFLSTLDELDKAGMPRVGAGRNLEEAANAQFFIVNGCKVGIVAASRAEKAGDMFTQLATDDAPGVMGTYESADFLAAIEAAKAQCDVLLVNVHWGTEMTTRLEDAQKTMAREYIDAGADAVIGGHPHCLQGMDFYNNVPIIYSVGNFWFNSRTVDSCIITIEIDSQMNITPKIVPLVQKNCESLMLVDYEERRALFDRVESYEPQGVIIDDNGTIRPNDGEES